jgi:hypothetical protein
VTEPEGDEQSRSAQIIGAVVLLVLVAAAVLAVIQIYPNKLTVPKNPSFIDNVFDSRIVVLLIRVALIFAAGYVVISVVGLILGRRWIAELGPFKASEPIARLEHSAEALEKDLSDAVTTIAELESRLEDSDSALAGARSDIGDLLDHIDRIEGEKAGD